MPYRTYNTFACASLYDDTKQVLRCNSFPNSTMPSTVPALLSTAAFVALAAASPPPAATSCKSDVDCSLNGVCAAGACKCDAPWTGAECGVLGYKTTPVSGKSLYPESDLHNSWNGAIIRATDGVYHLYNPLYPAGSLGGATALKHGTAANITGPYTWGEQPDIAIPLLPEFDGPKSVRSKLHLLPPPPPPP